VPFVKKIKKELPEYPIYIFKITTGAGKSQKIKIMNTIGIQKNLYNK
jgi:hypothetical protein